MNQPEERFRGRRDDQRPEHLDEMTCLLYLEGQLDRERARQVSTHAEICAPCRTLFHALERESRLLTRAMAEEDELLPARLLVLPERRVHSLQWIWAAAFGLAAMGVYALYTGYIEPWQQQLSQAGFGGTNLLSLLIFQGAFWKGWQSMISLFEILALLILASGGVMFLRRRLRRASALALLFAGFFAAVVFPASAAAAEVRHEQTYTLSKGETIKNDLYVYCGRARIDGTVEGDLIAFAGGVDVNGHVTGDVIAFSRTLRITGQVDGNVRAFTNTLTIGGIVSRNVTSFGDVFDLDSAAKIGGGATIFADTASLDGKIMRDVLAFAGRSSIAGSIGGNLKMKGRMLSIGSTADIRGSSRFTGKEPPEVSPQAKLASPIDFHKLEEESEYRHAKYYVWRVIWTAATLLFGLVLFLLMPQFARDTVGSAERYGASFGLGVLVLFGVPIAAVIACLTIVGIPLGVSVVILWLAALYSSQIVVGAVLGKWLFGPATEIWNTIGRMALGLILLQVVTTALRPVHYVGALVKLAVLLWGMGAISMALYKRFQAILPAAPSLPGAGGAPAV